MLTSCLSRGCLKCASELREEHRRRNSQTRGRSDHTCTKLSVAGFSFNTVTNQINVTTLPNSLTCHMSGHTWSPQIWCSWDRASWYTGCNRRNGPDFGRVSLRSNYTDITQNTYIQSSMFTEILAKEVWNIDSYYSLIDYQIHIETGRNMWFL